MGLNKLTVDIPDDLKTEFKVWCTSNNITMTEVVLRLIRAYLTEEKSKEK